MAKEGRTFLNDPDAIHSLASKGEDLPPIRKRYASEVRQAGEEGERQIEFIISTGSIDRDTDIIETEGWEFDHWLENPVVLWAHSHRDPPVAKGLGVEVDGNQVIATAQFPTRTELDVGPNESFLPSMIYRMYLGGYLSATSVGFDPLEWTFNEERGGVDFKRQDLLEFSAVPVPANPEALIAASGEGIDLAPLKSWAERVLDELPEPEEEGLPDAETLERAWKIARDESGPATVYVGGSGYDSSGQTNTLIRLPSGAQVFVGGFEGEGGTFELESTDEDADKASEPDDPTLCAECGKALEESEETDPEKDETTEPDDPVDLLLSLCEGEEKEDDTEETDPVAELASLSEAETRELFEDAIDEAVGKHITAVTGRLD